MTELTMPLFGADKHPNGIIHQSSLLKQMQFLAGMDSAKTGCTYQKLLEMGVVFVMTSVTLQMEQPLTTSDVLSVKTWEKEIKGPYFIREFIMTRDGEPAARASTNWVLMDTQTRSMVRPDRLKDIVIPRDAASAGTSFKKPKQLSMVPLGERRICYTDLDLNRHCNNTVYGDIAMDFSPISLEDQQVSLLHIDYRKECRMGELLLLSGCPVDQGFAIQGRTAQAHCFDAYVQLKKQ